MACWLIASIAITCFEKTVWATSLKRVPGLFSQRRKFRHDTAGWNGKQGKTETV
jgi:hypothetical protein